MVPGTPAAPSSTRTPGRLALRSAVVRCGAARFELSLADALAWLDLLVLGGVVLAALSAAWGARGAVPGALLLVLAATTARVVLVVTAQGSVLERRMLGVAWSRRPLGRHPRVESGIGWDWCELSVFPSDVRLRAGLHDGERAVLAEWQDHDPARDADGARLAALAQAEIARLHGTA